MLAGLVMEGVVDWVLLRALMQIESKRKAVEVPYMKVRYGQCGVSDPW